MKIKAEIIKNPAKKAILEKKIKKIEKKVQKVKVVAKKPAIKKIAKKV
jgi:hypothetical protein